MAVEGSKAWARPIAAARLSTLSALRALMQQAVSATPGRRRSPPTDACRVGWGSPARVTPPAATGAYRSSVPSTAIPAQHAPYASRELCARTETASEQRAEKRSVGQRANLGGPKVDERRLHRPVSAIVYGMLHHTLYIATGFTVGSGHRKSKSGQLPSEKQKCAELLVARLAREAGRNGAVLVR